MSRKKLIIIGIIFLLLAVALFIGAIVISRESADSGSDGASGSGGGFGKSLGDFFPFGKSSDEAVIGGSTGGPRTGSGDNQQNGTGKTGKPGFGEQGGKTAPLGALRQLTTTPTAGATVSRNKEDRVSVRYVDRALGHIFEVNPETLDSTRITNTTIPAVHEAWWGTPDSLVLRYLDDSGTIKTYGATIKAASTTQTVTGELASATLSGSFLDDDIAHVALSPDGTKMFSLKKIRGRGAGVISSFDGKSNQPVLDSAFSAWLPQWPSTQTVALAARASDGLMGSLYLLDIKTRALKTTLTKVPGLTALVSRDGGTVLYSESDSRRGNVLKTALWDVKKSASSDFTITTMPEKCVWGIKNKTFLYCGAAVVVPQGSLPDEWYQGLVSFSDNIWKIDTGSGVVEFLASPQRDARTNIDLINPFLSDDEEYLFFTNKNDLTLWALSLAQKTD